MKSQSSVKSIDLVTPDEVEEYWHSRSEFWLHKQRQTSKANRGKRQRQPQPLILSGHGVSLRVENRTLVVRNGFTHYPQKQEVYRFFPGDLELPERIILLDGTGTVSFNVLSWLAEQKVSLIKIDWRGNIVCICSQNGYSARPDLVEWQRQVRNDPKKRIEFCISLIIKKIEGTIKTLELAIPRTGSWDQALSFSHNTINRLQERPPKTVGELRIIEAHAAANYFRAWHRIPIRWRTRSRRPIPSGWNEIGQRTSIYHETGNRNADHPVNAILNYAYAVLQTRLQIEAVSQGYDPNIGIMHEATDGSPAFIFDLMEPERAGVDHKVLDFVRGLVFDPADFVIRSDGVCRLNPEMARCVANKASALQFAELAAVHYQSPGI